MSRKQISCKKKLKKQNVYELSDSKKFLTVSQKNTVFQIQRYYKSKYPYIIGIQFKKNFGASLLRKKLDYQMVFSLFCKMFF